MQPKDYESAIAQLVLENPRYPVEAYTFLREVMAFTSQTLKKPEHGPGRHMSGRELLDGMRRYALQEYGPIARTVLAAMGITRTEDLGELVFSLVNCGILGKTEEDRKSDFANGYDFREAFDAPFLPQSRKQAAPTPAPAAGTPPLQDPHE